MPPAGIYCHLEACGLREFFNVVAFVLSLVGWGSAFSQGLLKCRLRPILAEIGSHERLKSKLLVVGGGPSGHVELPKHLAAAGWE